MSKDFMNIERIAHVYRPAAERVRDFNEVEAPLTAQQLAEQSARCMGCGIPFCHGAGCPLGNLVPDFNEAVHKGDWKQAWDLLSSTSSFPEFTSRICPALCEGSCTEGLNLEPVMIRQIEKAIVETAFANGWVTPAVPAKRTGKKVIIAGAGPAGLAAAVLLNQAGHSVTLYEKNRFPGGLLRYGIPDFKLNKEIIERRMRILEESGIEFVLGTEVGADVSAEYLRKRCDALLITCGTPVPRDLKIPGRELKGIHFALEFLQGQNRVNSGELSELPVSAKGKRVLVIGGGDTGSDCVGTANRQGARSVTQIEIMPRPPEKRSDSTPWPNWPYMLRTSSSHEEGCVRRWDIQSRKFNGKNGSVASVDIVPVRWTLSPFGKPLKFEELADKAETIEADLVLLALGFLKLDRAAMLERLKLADMPEVFIAGDSANGPSLVVRAIVDGRKAAAQIDHYLSK
ncbi:MAG: glutamate synthase subunit beta [Victivallales bacterium]